MHHKVKQGQKMKCTRRMEMEMDIMSSYSPKKKNFSVWYGVGDTLY